MLYYHVDTLVTGYCVPWLHVKQTRNGVDNWSWIGLFPLLALHLNVKNKSALGVSFKSNCKQKCSHNYKNKWKSKWKRKFKCNIKRKCRGIKAKYKRKFQICSQIQMHVRKLMHTNASDCKFIYKFTRRAFPGTCSRTCFFRLQTVLTCSRQVRWLICKHFGLVCAELYFTLFQRDDHWLILSRIIFSLVIHL